jgi:hypothetical protein
LVEEVHRVSIPAVWGVPTLRSALVVFIVLAALVVHAAGGLEDVLGVEAAEGAGFEDLIHGVLRDHHPLRRVRHGQGLARSPVEKPHYPPSRARAGQKSHGGLLKQGAFISEGSLLGRCP